MIREVKVEGGYVRGGWAADPRISAFKGIPFAAPPVGKNRWRAPQPVEPWEGVRDCSRFAPISMQSIPGIGTDVYCREWNVDPDIPMDEDCLYLNVWTPAKQADEKLPVLVWFFGGALQWGYPAEMEFDGERLARRGIIVVTVNYRLNAFGFLAHPQITEESPEAPTNFGYLDQRAGLEWTIRNIAAFGGDPECITIAGQSAGGGSVLSHMTSPGSIGKFQRAMVMSGMISNPYADWNFIQPVPLTQAQKKGEDFFAYLGVSTLEEARALDACFIRDRYYEFCHDFSGEHSFMFNVLDGKFCVGDPLTLLARGECAHVPLMSGNTADEFLNCIEANNEEELREKARQLFGDRAADFLACPQVYEREGGYGFCSGIELMVKSQFRKIGESEEPKNCYYYRFDPDIPGWDHPGSFHSVDLWFFFETLAKCWRPFVGRHYDLARQMCNYFANFVKNGDPNGPDADGTMMPYWGTYTDAQRVEMNFTAAGAKPVLEEKSSYLQILLEKTANLL